MANRNVTQAVKLALISAGAVTAGLYGVVGSAQEQLSEIIVTGSRIARADLESASPITIIGREALADAGITDIGNLVQRIPSMSGSPIGTTTNNGGDGSVQIDLRGMGVDRTVTLVNGLRTVDGGDYQTIPATMIERIEVLKDGASAAYGADAVAGVVNIITRKDFEGLEISAQTADFFDMDRGAQSTVGLIAGKSFEGGYFVFGGEYVDQEEAFQSDAPWDFFQQTYYIYPAGCEKQLTAPYDGTPSGGCYLSGSSRIPEARLSFRDLDPDNEDGYVNYMNEGSGLVPFDDRLYNFAPVNYIQTPYTRTNLFAQGGFDLSDSVHFEGSFRGNFRSSEQELASMPFDTGPFLDPGYPVVNANGALVNGVSADNYYLVQAATAAGLPIEPVVRARRRMIERPRTFTQDVTQYQVAMTLSGSLADKYDWQMTYNTGYRSQLDNDYGQLAGSKLFNAMGPSADLDGDGQPECYRNISDPTSLIEGCVPLNLFGGPGSVTDAMYDYVGAILTDHRRTRLDEVGASLTGKAFKLPGGDLGWGVYAGYTSNGYTYSPDSLKSSFDVTGNKGEGTHGKIEAMSGSVEVLAPVFDNGTQSVTLSASVRYDDLKDIDSAVTWNAGFEFHPIEDLKLRGTAGTVFRSPTITDLFSGRFDDFPQFSDPCEAITPLPPGCAQASSAPDSQVLTVNSGNPNLIPETGDTFTVGLVWTPSLSRGALTATVDYWKIKLEDGISSYGIDYILDDCYVRQNAASCANITRDSNYEITKVIDDLVNVAKQGAEGIDAEVRYTWDTGIGDFEAAILWSHIMERTKVPYAGADEIDLSGRSTDPTAQDGGVYPADKVNYSIKWRWNDLTLAYQGEYISAVDSDTFYYGTEYIQPIDAQLYHDVLATYEFGTGTKITAGITNVTNEEPPFIEVGFNATTDPATYRLFGRGYYLRLSHKF